MEALALSHLLLFFITTFCVIFVGWKIDQSIKKNRTTLVRLLVTIPHTVTHKSQISQAGEVQQSAEIYKRLGELGIPFTLELAVHTVGEEINFYIISPAHTTKNVARLIQTLHPTSSVQLADDYELWSSETNPENDHLAIGYLTQAKPYCIPLKTAKMGHLEPFSPILRHLSNMAAIGQGGAIQWVVKPANKHLLSDIGGHLQKFKNGEYHPSRHIHERFILTPGTIKLLEEKSASPLFAVNCRIIMTTGASGKAGLALAKMAEHFETISTTDEQHNHFKFITPKRHDEVLQSFINYDFEPIEEMILTAEELATYFHFPGPIITTPKVRK